MNEKTHSQLTNNIFTYILPYPNTYIENPTSISLVNDHNPPIHPGARTSRRRAYVLL